MPAALPFAAAFDPSPILQAALAAAAVIGWGARLVVKILKESRNGTEPDDDARQCERQLEHCRSRCREIVRRLRGQRDDEAARRIAAEARLDEREDVLRRLLDRSGNGDG